jgi:hypothetical protein
MENLAGTTDLSRLSHCTLLGVWTCLTLVVTLTLAKLFNSRGRCFRLDKLPDCFELNYDATELAKY